MRHDTGGKEGLLYVPKMLHARVGCKGVGSSTHCCAWTLLETVEDGGEADGPGCEGGRGGSGTGGDDVDSDRAGNGAGADRGTGPVCSSLMD
jgi:hypothetical protein